MHGTLHVTQKIFLQYLLYYKLIFKNYIIYSFETLDIDFYLKCSYKSNFVSKFSSNKEYGTFKVIVWTLINNKSFL